MSTTVSTYLTSTALYTYFARIDTKINMDRVILYHAWIYLGIFRFVIRCSLAACPVTKLNTLLLSKYILSCASSSGMSRVGRSRRVHLYVSQFSTASQDAVGSLNSFPSFLSCESMSRLQKSICAGALLYIPTRVHTHGTCSAWEVQGHGCGCGKLPMYAVFTSPFHGVARHTYMCMQADFLIIPISPEKTT